MGNAIAGATLIAAFGVAVYLLMRNDEYEDEHYVPQPSDDWLSVTPFVPSTQVWFPVTKLHPTELTISAAGKAAIQKHEGYRNAPYRDIAGNWTVGIGHLIVPGDGLSPSMQLLDSQVYQIFDADLHNAMKAIWQYVGVPLTQGMFDALVNFVFQFGATKFRGSTLLKKLNAGDYEGASREFTRWVNAGGKPVASLVTRQNDNVKTFLA